MKTHNNSIIIFSKMFFFLKIGHPNWCIGYPHSSIPALLSSIYLSFPLLFKWNIFSFMQTATVQHYWLPWATFYWLVQPFLYSSHFMIWHHAQFYDHSTSAHHSMECQKDLPLKLWVLRLSNQGLTLFGVINF